MLAELKNELITLISGFIAGHFGKDQSFRVPIPNNSHIILEKGTWEIAAIPNGHAPRAYTHDVGEPLDNLVRTIYTAKTEQELYDALPTVTKNLPSLLFFSSSNPLRDLNILLNEWLAHARLNSLRAGAHGSLDLLVAELKARLLELIARLNHLHPAPENSESTEAAQQMPPICASLQTQIEALEKEMKSLSTSDANYSRYLERLQKQAQKYKAQLVRLEWEYPINDSIDSNTITSPTSAKQLKEMIRRHNEGYNGERHSAQKAQMESVPLENRPLKF